MVFVLETSNPDVIHALTEVAKALNVAFRVEPDAAVVSPEERKRRTAIIRRFKGNLKKYAVGDQPDKHEWYQQ